VAGGCVQVASYDTPGTIATKKRASLQPIRNFDEFLKVHHTLWIKLPAIIMAQMITGFSSEIFGDEMKITYPFRILDNMESLPIVRFEIQLKKELYLYVFKSFVQLGVDIPSNI